MSQWKVHEKYIVNLQPCRTKLEIWCTSFEILLCKKIENASKLQTRLCKYEKKKYQGYIPTIFKTIIFEIFETNKMCTYVVRGPGWEELPDISAHSSLVKTNVCQNQ